MSGGRTAALNSRFGVPGVAFRPGPGGLESVEVENGKGTATVALQGAHVLAWAPRGEEPVVWLSEAARFVPGAAVRGGIPICWPWFGPHPTDAARPQHGFARTSEWQVVAVERLPDERTRLTFRLPDGHGGDAWPHRTEVLYVVTVGRTLELDLVTRNAGEEPLAIGQALHTYFRVSDYERVTVHGVEGCRYLDKVSGAEGLQDRPLTLTGKFDRVFLGSSRDCIIEDPGLSRAIRVAKRSSSSTVVWNPGIAGATGDYGPRGSREMLCLETANVANDVVRLAPHAVHVLFARVSVGPPG
ncbi:MAG TPA: D-hexose-6-phosphate mutarotase [Anaeromyxobacter sp.]|nr:D-hexose-6-phosphate mutarotase [Anaeromyxobacter sp.]